MQNVTIEAGHIAKNYWRDLWRNRELLWILAKRDLSVRYKQTLIGAGWAVIRPLATTAAMVIVFEQIAKFPPDPGVPYSLMVLAGITIWTFFSNTFSQISMSIMINANLVSKVYFPRLIMPLSSVVVGFVDLVVALGLYLIFAIYKGHLPQWNVVFLPFFLLLSLATSFAFGLFFAVLNIRFRDIAQLIPFLMQIGMYACPIMYSSSLVDINFSKWSSLYFANPVVGIVEGFKWCLLGTNAPLHIESVVSSVVVTVVLLAISIYFFRQKENSFVDYI